ncbi:CLUMA_CG007540, isoform A [Clunio marinus]|uniref:CLUMA_CG007540, isoform A n=1 Tax=Clunio marinus TaxID=568069 RepID=A0A1J1I0Z2_9DIPT|nr:CLUMA_CG007540, isoform A [Clunio marinus]
MYKQTFPLKEINRNRHHLLISNDMIDATGKNLIKNAMFVMWSDEILILLFISRCEFVFSIKNVMQRDENIQVSFDLIIFKVLRVGICSEYLKEKQKSFERKIYHFMVDITFDDLSLKLGDDKRKKRGKDYGWFMWLNLSLLAHNKFLDVSLEKYQKQRVSFAPWMNKAQHLHKYKFVSVNDFSFVNVRGDQNTDNASLEAAIAINL